jgi:hypothetical protein
MLLDKLRPRNVDERHLSRAGGGLAQAEAA